MNNNKLISIVIANWNAGELLAACVTSIGQFGQDLIESIVVVDNGSTDYSLESLPVDIDNLLIHKEGQNHGFAKACNIGAMLCDSDYLLFLNPDAMLMEHSLDKALAFMQSVRAKDVGICGVKLLDQNGNVQRHCTRFPTLRSYFGHATGLSLLSPNWFSYHFMEDFDHLTSREVNHVIGAFFLVRRSLFEQLHGFDERYFVYLEDLDFSLRAHKLGWKTHYLADAVAYHKGGGTSDQVKAHRLFYSLRSRIIYAFRHFSRPAAWGVVGLTLLVEPWPRLVRAVLRRSWQELRDTLRGYSMLCKDLPATLKKGRSDD